MKFLAQKQLSSLRPLDEAGEEALRKIKNGSTVEIEIKQPRNVQHHRKFFAMLNIVLKNQEHYKSIDHILGACKLAIGHVEMIQTKRGVVALPLSISFASMDQSAFDDFYTRAVDWVISDVIPGLSRKDLDAEVAGQLREFA